MTTGLADPRARAGVPVALRIAHLAAPGEVGGLERVLVALATGQAAAGHAVRAVLVLERPEAATALVDELEAGGVAVDRIVVAARAYLAEHRQVRARVASFGADLAHSHGYRADLVAAPAARHAGARLVTTAHGFTGGGLRNLLYEAAQRRAFRRFDAVVAVSRSLHERLARSGVPAGRLHYVPNAYAPMPLPSRDAARALLGLAPGAGRRIGWVGRLSHEKGPDVLLRAVAHPAFPVDARVSIVGDGPELPRLRALATALGVDGRVTWHGVVPRAHDVMPALDCFVLSSRTEGTPITLFEAIDARVPVVATRVGGVPDVTGDDGALLVAPDDPAALARAVAATLSDAAAALRAATARVRLESNYGAAEWLGRYESLYRSLLPRRVPAARQP